MTSSSYASHSYVPLPYGACHLCREVTGTEEPRNLHGQRVAVCATCLVWSSVSGGPREPEAHPEPEPRMPNLATPLGEILTRAARPVDGDPDDWMASALCAQVDGDAWYPDIGEPAAPAKAMCRRCPALDQCREYADEVETGTPHHGLHGIWSGETPRERWQRRHRRQVVA